MTAPGIGSTSGASIRASLRLAGAGEAADGDECRRGRRDRAHARSRNRRAPCARSLPARASLARSIRGGGDLGADRRAHRQEERQRRSASRSSTRRVCGEIAVEHDIRGRRQSALEQVHQQESQIVEHVAGGDDVAELDGVEQNRLAVDQHDVAEMKIAVNAADETAAAPLAQQRRRCAHRQARLARASVVDFSGGKNVRVLPERLGVFVDIGAERRDPGVRFDGRRLGVGRGDGAAERIGQARRRFRRRDGRACASRRSAASRPPIRPASPEPPIASLPDASRVIATTPR